MHRALPSILSFVVLLAVLPSSRAAAQGPLPVDLVMEGVFGPEALIEGGYGGLVVTLTNRTAQPFTGHVEVAISEWNSPPERHIVELDLPAGESRRAQVTVFIATSGVSIDARYVDDDGRVLGEGSQSVAYAPATTSLVILADQPARLRAALLDLATEEPTEDTGYPSYGAGTRTVSIPIGGNALDGRTGDPIVPSDPHAYATVRMVIASAATFARLGEREQAALEDYVIAGGTLVIAPRNPADFALPPVRRLFGEVTRAEGLFAAAPYAPPETFLQHCERATDEDGVGCVLHLGHGLVRLATWDLTNPASAGDGDAADNMVRALVLQLIDERDGRTPTALPLGTGLDATDGGYWDGTSSFGAMRRSLDPNEGYRTSLALVSVLLFLYVLVVGPLHFRLIERRNQPTLALITTPLLAMSCAAVLFAVGYLGKGVVMRYRRLSVVELAQDSERAVSRSYTGYFFTRPTSATLRPEPGAFLRRVAAPSGIAGPRYVHHEGVMEADAVRGGLWDTIFVREEAMIDAPGGVHFDLVEGRLAIVRNDTDWTLSSAIVVDITGAAYVVGDVPPHGRAPVPNTTGWYLYESGGGWTASGTDATTTSLSALLRVPAEDAAMMRGVQSLLAGELIENTAPVLYAWIEAPPDPDTDPSFTREWDRRLLRVASLPEHRPIASALRYGGSQ
jgi:hypothetical protein